MKDFKYSLIAAISKTNNVIGNDEQIPWKSSTDMKYFKRVTTGNVVIMGRKTFESIGKELPNRINIVVTSDQRNISPDFNGIIANSLDMALRIASTYKDKETFVIGGGQLYKEAIETVHKLYITWVTRLDNEEIEGNVFFPNINTNQNFRLVDVETYDGDKPLLLEFNTFIRK